MNSTRKTAVIVGVLFITATVSAILSLVLSAPILDDPDYLTKVSENENQVLISVLLELILASAGLGISVMMFPILRKHHEGLALGYVGFRIFEPINVIVGAISTLTLLTLSQEFVRAGSPDALHFQTLGTLLLAVRDWTFLIGPMFLFSLGAMILYYLLYQSKIVPRFISVWGFIGAALLLTRTLLIMFSLTTEFSVLGIVTGIPIAVNEMFLAAWLIVKGFNSSAIASESTKTDTNKV